jgi:RHS repeat-associated protein
VPGSESWHYDLAGNADGYTNPAGNFKHMFYDTRNRNCYSFWDGAIWNTPDHSVGQEVNVGYDHASRVTSITTNGGETTLSFGYDDANWKVWEDQTLAGYPTRRVNTPRDQDGNRTSLDVANYYHIDYSYTQRNQLKSVNGVAGFTYDGNGNLTHRSADCIYNSGTNFSYDELNRVTQIEQGNAWYVFARSHYQYDNLSREVATWRDEQLSKGEWFRYNVAGELTTAIYNADNVWTANPSNWSSRRDYNYTPDLLNWTSVNDNGYLAPFEHDALNQYTSVNTAALAYDGNFNQTAYGTQVTSFDAQNRLVSLNNSGNGTSAQFTYDGLGRCVRRTINGVTRLFTYDGWKPMLEWDGAGNWLAWNIYGAGPDEILARYDSSGQALIYKQDQHGNVVAVLDQYGGVVENYTYDVFGEPTILSANNTQLSTSAVGNRFMFQGREYLNELGIYDFRARMYHPGLGRFLQKDPIDFAGGDANLFRYCGGDPVNKSDPSGLDVVITLQEATGFARSFDHIGLGVNTTATQGFYGSNQFDLNGMVGHIKSDNASSDQILGSITISTTPAQDAIIAGVFSQFDGTTYGFPDRNCATAVAAALQAAGLKFDPSNIPYTLFNNLVKAYPPGHGSRVTYPNGPQGGSGTGQGGGGGGETRSGNSSFGISIGNVLVVYTGTPTTLGSDLFNQLMSQPGAFYVVGGTGTAGGIAPDSIGRPRYPAGQKRH